MYKEHFRLRELPFSIAPDPRYLFMSDQHRDALAHLLYGINSDGGFVLLTGEVGTGKTTVCRCLVEQIPEHINVAFILNPKLTVEELLAVFCDELGIRYPEGNMSIKVFVDLINAYLLDVHARGRKTVLIIEEAQNFSADVLEQIRLLTNLETNQQKLLQIIMVGQPELREKLSRPELRQLSQRITARYHLGPLKRKEIAAYVNHRLAVAGAHSNLFPISTMSKLNHFSRGIPRLINIICDRALLGAYAQGRDKVDKATLTKAAREVLGKPTFQKKSRKALRLAVASLIIVGIIAVLTFSLILQGFLKDSLNLQGYVKKIRPPVKTKERLKLSKLQWPEEQPINDSKNMAYRALLKEWGINYNPDMGDPCNKSNAEGLSCLATRGSLNGLMQLNRPAILKLFDDQGREFFATLTAMNEQIANLTIGTKTILVDVKEIALRWHGDYIILWRMPPEYKGYITHGSKGPEVQWLDKQLALIQGRSSSPERDIIFDDYLAKQVKEFQLTTGLIPDGIVGPQTIIHLNAAVGAREPILMNKKKVP